MKKKVLTILIFCFALLANAAVTQGNNYDDVDGFFEKVSVQPGVEHWYISKSMIKVLKEFDNIRLQSVGYDKIEFVRRASLKKAGNKPADALVLSLVKRATECGFKKEFVNQINVGESGARQNNLFVKNGEGGLCSALIIRLEYEQGQLQAWDVLLIGGIFKAQDVPDLITD